jgi:hypothetical protein
MRVFVDANIVISVLNREYPLFTWSSRLLSLPPERGIELYTSPLSLAISFYFASKKCGEKAAKAKLELLCKHVNVTSISKEMVYRAFQNSQIIDFEDGLEYYSALEKRCECIVTENNEDFYFSTIEVIGCKDFLVKLKNGKTYLN